MKPPSSAQKNLELKHKRKEIFILFYFGKKTQKLDAYLSFIKVIHVLRILFVSEIPLQCISSGKWQEDIFIRFSATSVS